MTTPAGTKQLNGPVLNVGAGGTLVARLRTCGVPEADDERIQVVLDALRATGAEALVLMVSDYEQLDLLTDLVASLAQHLGWASHVQSAPGPRLSDAEWRWVSGAVFQWLLYPPASAADGGG